jgi:hypothetical protein
VLEDWRDPAEALPVAPVSAVVSVTLVDAAGGETVVAGRSTGWWPTCTGRSWPGPGWRCRRCPPMAG